VRAIVELLLIVGMFVSLFPSALRGEDFTAHSIGDYENVTVMEVSGNYDADIPGAKKDVPRQSSQKNSSRPTGMNMIF